MNPDFFYKTIIPFITGGFYSELEGCIKMLRAIAMESDADLFKLIIYHDPDNEEEDRRRKKFTVEALNESFPGKCPTFVLVGHAPADPYAVAVEAGFVKKESCRVQFRHLENCHYVVLEYHDVRELWASGIRGADNGKSFDDSAIGTFKALHAILEKESMNFNHIVRQWNYIGGIVQNNIIADSVTTNYQIFNEIRHRFYQQYRTVKGYPAATGIGNKFLHVDIDVCAVQSHGQKLVTCAVENPEQLNPYQYDQQVLEGLPILNEKVKHPPEFERAKLLVVEGHVRLFISGTASIIGQETIGIGDIEKQTHCTISNIEKLTDPVNVRKSYPGLKTGRFRYSFVRVYVKDRQDLEATISICRQKFGNVPVSYVVVDVCRDELLVEIEGEMIFESVSDLS